MQPVVSTSPSPDRRSFLKTTAVTAGTLAALSQFPSGVHARDTNILKIGLIGCGGRGSDALYRTLAIDPNVKLHALGDAFMDKIDDVHAVATKRYGSRVDVGDRKFDGFDAYKKVIAECDFVMLATPPHFRPIHLAECVAQKKHVFFEKPVAVDGPGIRSVIESAKKAKEHNICFASGFCYRYDLAKRETIKRIHGGAIGDVVAMQINYNTGPLRVTERDPSWTEMQYHVRNWYYFTWLSGDHNVEQHVHNHDKASWVMKGEMPISAMGLGGRQTRVEPKFGNIFDHHAVVYEYANGVKLFSFCRQQKGCHSDVSDHVMGSKGSAQLMEHTIANATKWRYQGPEPNMYDQEMTEILASARSDQPINDGISAANSSMMAILGRMATYSGQVVTWQEAMNSELSLAPTAYTWDTQPPKMVVAMPGTKQKVF